MGKLLEFARGPLFTATFLLMILGLLRQVFIAVFQFKSAYNKISYRDFSPGKGFKSIIEWLIPVGHIYRSKPVLSIVSFVFHIGIILVPILLPHHIFLFKRGIGISWPGIPLWFADILTVITIITILFLISYRIFDKGTRNMSGGIDYYLLILIGAAFVSGFLALHPSFNPISYTGMMLIHVLSGEIIFILMPYSKLVHCVLFPFERISSDIFWKFPIGAAEKVARELHGEEAKV